MAKAITVIVIWILGLTPTWFFLVVRFLANPDGFWQNLVLIGLGTWFLGSAQVMFFMGTIVISLNIITDY